MGKVILTLLVSAVTITLAMIASDAVVEKWTKEPEKDSD